MPGNLELALRITIIGMGLVFAAIVLLWGVIALLVRATADAPARAPAERSTPADLPLVRRAVDSTDSRLRRRAAAIAVAAALAQAERWERHSGESPQAGFSPLPAHPISPWQAMVRGQQSEQPGRRGWSR